jgi:hypothetical protein
MGGVKLGKMMMFTGITKIKEGHAPALRQTLQKVSEERAGAIGKLGTIHFVRWAMFDNDTRLLFATTFDGDIEDYMRDFAEKSPGGVNAIWSHCEGFPGAEDFPKLRDYILAHEIETTGFYTAYPDLTVNSILQARDWKEKFEKFLDQIQT